MADRFMSRVSVTLAAGASTSVAHSIVVGGVATAPQIVYADRMTSIQVDTVDATNLNLSNPGSAAATAIFWSWFVHSEDATPSDTSPGIFWKGSTGGGAAQLAPFTNDYYVEAGVTTDVAARLYPTVATALAAADTALAAGVPIVIHLHRSGGHTWDGTSIPTGRSIAFMGDGARVAISISGVWAAVVGGGQGVAFVNCAVTLSASVTTGAARGFALFNSTYTGGSGIAHNMAQGTIFTAQNSTMNAPRIVGAGLGCIVTLTSTVVGSTNVGDATPALVADALLLTAIDCQFSVTEDEFTIVEHSGVGGAAFTDCVFTLQNTGAGDARVAGTTITLDVAECYIEATLGGAGAVLLGGASGSISGSGLECSRIVSQGTGAYTISTTDGTIVADTTGGAVALTLPNAADVVPGQSFLIKRTTPFFTSQSDVTITPDAGDTLEGSAGAFSMNSLCLDRPAVRVTRVSATVWSVVAVGGTVTGASSAGTPGNATVQASNGRSAFAGGAATCVITNAYVTATSRILVSLNTVDATLTSILTVVPGAGSFTVTGNAAATGTTIFSWVVLPG